MKRVLNLRLYLQKSEMKESVDVITNLYTYKTLITLIVCLFVCLFVWDRAYESWIRNGCSNL